MSDIDLERQLDQEIAEAKAAAELAERQLKILLGLQARFERLLPHISDIVVVKRVMALVLTMFIYFAQGTKTRLAENGQTRWVTAAEFKDATRQLTQLIMEEEARVGGEVAN